MKTGCHLTLMCLLLGISLFGQNWTQVASMNSLRAYSVGFSIGNYGYTGMGTNISGSYNDIWRFDPVNNLWSQVASCPCSPRGGAFSFTIDTVGYVGLGASTLDCWKYFPVLNSWFPVDSFPGGARTRTVGFSIGNKGYVVSGTSIPALQTLNEFWQYDPQSDAWVQLDTFPGPRRTGGAGFAIGGCGFIGLGCNSSTYFSDFWKYDTLTGLWSAIASFPGPVREGAIGLGMLGIGYISSGGTPYWPYDHFADLWSYDPTGNYWQQLPSYGMWNGRRYVDGFVIDSSLYVGAGVFMGFDPPPYYFNDYYRFSVNTITEVLTSINHNPKVWYNVARCSVVIISEVEDGTATLYDLTGNPVLHKEMASGENTMETTFLAPGVYVINMNLSGKNFSSLIVIHK